MKAKQKAAKKAKPAKPEQMYYLLSPKHSRGGLVLWWGPNNAGYFQSLDMAGKYSQSKIDSDPSYYDNGDGAVPVPCEIVEAMASRVVREFNQHLRKFQEESKARYEPERRLRLGLDKAVIS